MGSTYDTRGSSCRFQLLLTKTKKGFGYMGEFRLEKKLLTAREFAWMQVSMNLFKSELELLASPASLIPYYSFRLEYFIKG